MPITDLQGENLMTARLKRSGLMEHAWSNRFNLSRLMPGAALEDRARHPQADNTLRSLI
ncbi:hypothetical protein [Beijerinckia sp. L45]|uniref:hypothetical protein n=1 Tax=Beijerinckia sp. L45 TaxID=1641855 RepID=UPI00131C3DB1|nr:hypothetical protein [Beijerinckia sp. L45]